MLGRRMLNRGRTKAAERMTETVHIYTETTTRADGSIGVTTTQETHYRGPAQVKFNSTVVSEQDTVGQVLSTQNLQLALPVGADGGVVIDATAEITASTVDTSLVGRRFRVQGMPQGGQTTAHRWPVEEVR